jgi:hypothetical protein
LPVPFGSLIPQRSRVLPQGGAVLGQLTGTFQAGLEQGRMRAAEEQAPDLLLNYLETQGQGYGGGGTLGNLAAPATGYVGGQQAPQFNGMPTQANADLQTALTPGSETFDGRFALRRENASQQNPAPQEAPPDYAASIAGYGSGLNTTGLDAQFGTGLDSAIQAYIAAGGDPSTVQINSLVRSTEEQRRLYDAYQRGEIGLAAPPGRSRHEYGAAADIQSGPFLDWLHQNAGQYGLSFLQGDAFTNDPGHVQLQGASPAGTRLPAVAGGASPSGRGYSTPPAWTPPTQAERMQLRALMLNPATRQMGYQLAIQRMTPPAPIAPPEPVVINGQLVDRMTGQVIGDYRDPQAAAGGGFRPLVNPQERAAMGIPPTDTGFYQVGPDGRVYRESGGGTNVEVNIPGEPMIGTIPPSWQAIPQEGGGYVMEPIPGGPAAAEAERTAAAATAAGTNAGRQTSVLLTNIDGAMALAEQPLTTGLTGAVAAALPGTPAYDLRAKVDTIKAIIGFQTLQEMRAASPTGAALGAITQQELQFLQATWGNLDPNQSYNAFVQQLNAARQITIDIVDGRRTVDENGNVIQRQAGGGAAPDGTVVQLPDGTFQIKQNGQWVPYAR